jgi:hypothetical protein
MKRVLLIALALLLVGILAAQGMMNHGKLENHEQRGFAGKERMKREHQPNMMMRIMQNLELSEKQMEELQSNRVAMQKKEIQVQADIQTLEIDARIAHLDMDFKQLKKISSSIFDLKKELKLEHIANMEKCWNVLTDEQKAEAQELMKRMPRRDCEGCEEDEEGNVIKGHRREMKQRFDD